jgi:hypothetical protein
VKSGSAQALPLLMLLPRLLTIVLCHLPQTPTPCFAHPPFEIPKHRVSKKPVPPNDLGVSQFLDRRSKQERQGKGQKGTRRGAGKDAVFVVFMRSIVAICRRRRLVVVAFSCCLFCFFLMVCFSIGLTSFAYNMLLNPPCVCRGWHRRGGRMAARSLAQAIFGGKPVDPKEQAKKWRC